MKYIKEVLTRLSRSLYPVIYYSGIYAVLDAIFRIKGIYIIVYHRFAERENGKDIPFLAVDIKSFEEQIELFKSRYRVITMDEAVKLLSAGQKIRRDYLVITFDDGYKDNYTYGYPAFKKYELSPTIYLTAGNVDNQTPLWHDRVWKLVFDSRAESIGFSFQGIQFQTDIKTQKQKQEAVFQFLKFAKELDEVRKSGFLNCLENACGTAGAIKCDFMLNWDEVKKLSDIGVDIGGHTLSHPILAKNSEAFITSEIEGSKKLIENRLNRNINHFSYPNGKYGDYNEFTIREVSKHYKSAATTIQGINFRGDSVYKLKRIYFSNDAGLIYIKVKLLSIKVMETFYFIKSKIKA